VVDLKPDRRRRRCEGGRERGIKNLYCLVGFYRTLFLRRVVGMSNNNSAPRRGATTGKPGERGQQ
jgi:hypothetical protein